MSVFEFGQSSYGELRAMQMAQAAIHPSQSYLPSYFEEHLREILGNQTTSKPPDIQFTELKKSVKIIEAEPFDGEVRKRIEGKINRLQSAGAIAQAMILERELQTRDSLIRLKEWDYKLLTKEAISKFQRENQMTLTRDGLKIHIDPLDKYCGNPQAGEAKDRIIPDNILDELETAKERELFDGYAVLWAEKVKDPLLLGIVNGCEDYFFIAEWGDDVTFEEIVNGENCKEKTK